ncbi:hypothetical protein KR222_011169 [Zaprionus bogoriensis]|nr:hypothetical protein KR222_011169 [Zaprionus bogoriensis]
MPTTFVYIVLIALTANLLSVSGLRCHQCNSHENEDCVSLLVNTPRGQRDEQYLRECAPRGEMEAFCRKTVIKMDVNDQHRVERSCGWLEEKLPNTCFTADNEGYKRTICTCKSDACNGVRSILSSGIGSGLATTLALTIAGISLLRH